MRGSEKYGRRRRKFSHHRRGLRVECLEARRVLDASAIFNEWFSSVPAAEEYQPHQLLLEMTSPDQEAPPLEFPEVTITATARPGLFKVSTPSEVAAQQVQEILAAEPNVAYVEPLRQFELQTDDQLFPNDWGSALWGMHNFGQNGGVDDADIDAPEAWFHVTDASSVVVADIDTGVDYTHPDLYLNIWINQGEIPATRMVNLTDVDSDGVITFRDLNDPVNQGPGKIDDLNENGYIDGGDLLEPMLFVNGEDGGLGGWENQVSDDGDIFVDDLVGWDFVNGDNDPIDDHNHGTHTVGTIAGVGDNGYGVVGVAWNARVMAMKFLNGNGSGSSIGAANSIIYSAVKGAQISSNSWGGGGFSQTLSNAISDAETLDQLFVAAAGNNGRDTDAEPFYPAGYTQGNVLAVASTTRSDGRSSFSNYGATTVDLGAPGSAILSTVRNGGYATFSGTSMATPHVAGAAALVLATEPGWTYDQVKTRLMETVDPIPALDGVTVTGGRLNVHRAVYNPPPPDPTDILVHQAWIRGDQVVVEYEIVSADSQPFDVQLVLSNTGELEGATELGRLTIDAADQLALGSHQAVFAVGAGGAVLPGNGIAPQEGQHYVIAVADPDDLVEELDETPLEDNVAIAAGSYLDEAGDTVMILGTPGDDQILFTSLSVNVRATVNGDDVLFPAASLADVRVQANDGDDDVNGFGSNLPIAAYGGDGDDTLSGGNAADTLHGEGGVNVMRFLGGGAKDRVTVEQRRNQPITLQHNGVFDVLNMAPTDSLYIDGAGGGDVINVKLNFTYATATLIGGPGNDVIDGGVGDDLIRGDAGDDRLNGGRGFNVLDGGTGSKDLVLLKGGGSSDHLVAEWNDELGVLEGKRLNASFVATWASQIIASEMISMTGSNGNDLLDASSLTTEQLALAGVTRISINGGNGSDEIYGSQGRDSLQGSNGNDLIYGFGGNDTINGGNQNDVIYGGEGDDTINGGQGDDQIFGEGGKDRLNGGGGVNELSGGEGVDRFTVAGGKTNDRIVAEWDPIDSVAVFRLSLLSKPETYLGVDRVSDVEEVTLSGSNGDDYIDASAIDATVKASLGLAKSTISGGNGDDVLIGSVLGDIINAGAGNDEIHGREGHDRLNGSSGNDVIYGGAGNDRISAGADDDVVFGEEGDDNLAAGGGSDILVGGLGNDLLSGSPGQPNLLIGGVGADRLNGRDHGDLLIGGSTTHDADAAALQALLAEWGSNAAYEERIARLRGELAGGANGGFLLNAETVTHDAESDRLNGNEELDWFWADLADLADNQPEEQVN